VAFFSAEQGTARAPAAAASWVTKCARQLNAIPVGTAHHLKSLNAGDNVYSSSRQGLRSEAAARYAGLLDMT
jgi:hypothetical protein